ncbi:hypothetical protein EAE96_001221 [Botrytis aclada]|nr:hypothetical protein EAE96_001221 [Botrytis aclada]
MTRNFRKFPVSFVYAEDTAIGRSGRPYNVVEYERLRGGKELTAVHSVAPNAETNAFSQSTQLPQRDQPVRPQHQPRPPQNHRYPQGLFKTTSEGGHCQVHARREALFKSPTSSREKKAFPVGKASQHSSSIRDWKPASAYEIESISNNN